MGELIDINKNKPHLRGEAVCLNCNHSWVAITPVGTMEGFECPECGRFGGIYCHPVCLPSKDKQIWQCSCGNVLFAITPDETLCSYCGTAQNFG